jgi:C4-dicarboxylate transporter DctM subunit
MAAGIPISVAVIGATFLALAVAGGAPLALVPQQMFIGGDSFPLLAVPFFIFAGCIMHVGGSTERLVALAQALVGRLRAGFGMVAIVTAMFFAGISGSAVADTSAVGGVLGPAMIERGYRRGLVASLLASAGAIGPIIPPSIIMIVYGSITDLSIGALFLGGFAPGILIGMGLMGITYIYSFMYPEMSRGARMGWGELRRAAWRAAPSLMLPIVVIGGILGGVFTATEAGAVACVYALAIGALVHRKLSLASLWSALVETAETTGVVMLLIVASLAFGWLLSQNRFEIVFERAVVTLSFGSSGVALAIVIIMLLMLGFFFEVMAAAIMLAPTLHAVGLKLGYDPIHFGLVVVVALMIGAVTPPVGVLLFLGCRIANTTLVEAWKFVYPYTFAMVAVLFLIAYVPWIVLFLPKLLMR